MTNLDKVTNFISEYWRIKDKDSIKANKSLSDLGFYGDDKLEFIESFFEYFNIEHSNFDYNKYIEPEKGFFNPFSLIKLLFGYREKSPYEEITINDLINSLNNKKWKNKIYEES